MKNTIKEEVNDTAIDHATHAEFRKDCSNCFTENLVAKYSAKINEVKKKVQPKFRCPDCEDTGVIEKIEWVGTDTSYPKYIRCNCQE